MEETIGFLEEHGIVVAIVIMEDAPLHTEANGYHCDDLSCPCWDEAPPEPSEFDHRMSNLDNYWICSRMPGNS